MIDGLDSSILYIRIEHWAIQNTAVKECRTYIVNTLEEETILRSIRRNIMNTCLDALREIHLCGLLMYGICMTLLQMPEIRAESLE